MKTLRLAIAISISMLIASTAIAANGDIGETVSAESSLTLTINKLITLTDVPSSINFGSFTGNGALTQTESVCVATNIESSPLYKVTASGSGTDSAFTLAAGTNTIAYTVAWYNASGGSGGSGTSTSLTAATASSDQSNGYTQLSSCPTGGGGTANASFVINFTEAVLRAAYAGTYTGTLTIMVDPQ